jgi:hypothetical protein
VFPNPERFDEPEAAVIERVLWMYSGMIPGRHLFEEARRRSRFTGAA